MTEHKHAWKFVAHMDSCHRFESAYACKCGATANTWGERDPKSNPYAAIHMMDDELPGEHGRCQRCDELLAGAEPKDGKTITEARAEEK